MIYLRLYSSEVSLDSSRQSVVEDIFTYFKGKLKPKKENFSRWNSNLNLYFFFTFQIFLVTMTIFLLVQYLRDSGDPLRQEFLKEYSKQLQLRARNLHPGNLSLINITNFQFIINNDVCDMSSIAIITIVHSALDNSYARHIIR